MNAAAAPQLIIFDSDGVLVDSEPISRRIFGELLTGRGLHVEPDELDRDFRGRRMSDCLAILREKHGVELPSAMIVEYEDRLFAAFERDLRPVPGVRELLGSLKIPVCVATSGSHEKLRRALTVTGLLDFFGERRFAAEDVTRGKPAPDLFLLAALRSGVSPDNCVVIEDSPRGVEAAVAAGMRVLGYAADTPVDELVAAGAEPFSSMGDVPDLLVNRGGHDGRF